MATTRTPRPLASALDAIEVILGLLDREPATTLAALLDRLPGQERRLIHGTLLLDHRSTKKAESTVTTGGSVEQSPRGGTAERVRPRRLPQRPLQASA